jgi:serine/threonine protein kinase/predicted ATPase/DNA-binding SARP family transcriptional activator
MSRLEISLPGPFRVALDGEPVTQFEADTARALLAYLALHSRMRAPCRRETLAGLLWPEQPETEARHNLRQALSRLRTAIGDRDTHVDLPFLLISRKTIQLNPESDTWLDVATFEGLVAACQEHAHRDLEACPQCVERLREAADLYRGDLLAGFTLSSAPFEAWLVVEREQRHRQVLDALHHLTVHHTEAGEYEQAERYARRQLELEPWRETAHRQLMRALASRGQRAAALRQYEQCQRVLEEELGVPPERETVKLYRAILENQERAAAVESRPARYRLERVLSSKGSFGDIWLATDTLLDRQVACKCPKVGSDRDRRERFLAEARMLARLDHPHITQVYDVLFDEREDRVYLVMEHLQGKDLGEMLREGYDLSLEDTLEIATGVLEALAYAHERGVVHRDVKPQNVMITYAEPGVKLLDFGLAELGSILQQGSDYLVGTAAYMAPEQVEGQPVDRRADLYAVGMMLYEMVSGGRRPFEGTDEDQVLEAHLHATPPPLRQYAPTVPPALEQIVMRLLAKDPEDRYPSAEAVIEALGTVRVGPRISNLPVSLTPFVGREREMAEIGERLCDPDCRLLTLVGPGGIGKTRLAAEAARAYEDAHAHGACFAPLAALQSAEAIVPAVAQALGLRLYEGVEPREQVLDYLWSRDLLLILDNCEHLLAPLVGEGSLVTDILQTAPKVCILATSRERLNVEGEYLIPVAGMDVPPAREAGMEGGQWADCSAVRLFLHSAQRVRPDFALTGDALMHVVRICRLAEGIPLAILLAASWVELLAPRDIAREIEAGFGFLETDLRDVPERHRSMRAVFDASWRLLGKRERMVLRGLSAFRGGFTRAAAQAVTRASLRDLMALTHKSLLRRAASGRYDVAHQLLRQYATTKLEDSGQVDAVRDAHAAYYARFMRQHEEDLEGRRQVAALDEIEADLQNVRAAWTRALEQGNQTAIGYLLNSLSWFGTYRSRYHENQEPFRHARERLAPRPGEEPHLVWGRILLAEFYSSGYQVDRAQIERGLAIARRYGWRRGVAAALQILGQMAAEAGDPDEAISLYEESIAISREEGHRFYRAESLLLLAEAYGLSGRPEQAIESARKSLALSREIGDRFWAARALANTGVISFYTGNYAEARDHLQEANVLYRQMGHGEGVAATNAVLSKLAGLRGDRAQYEALKKEALEIAQDIGGRRVMQSARYLPELMAQGLLVEEPRAADGRWPGPPPGTPTAIDRFRIKSRIGIGGMAAVYQAYDPQNERDVALKVVRTEAIKSAPHVGWWHKSEASFLEQLAHPAFPAFYGYGETEDCVYIAVEFIEGADLEGILEEAGGTLPERDAIRWAIEVCDALAYLHRVRPLPVIFRDLKPSNVMIDHKGQVRLIDLGISVTYQPGQPRSAIGTAGYASPEQYSGYADARSDVYALGATLHHLLTGRDPRKKEAFTFHDAPPRALNPAVSEALEAVILKATEHNPLSRYQTAEEMKAALLACL